MDHTPATEGPAGRRPRLTPRDIMLVVAVLGLIALAGRLLRPSHPAKGPSTAVDLAALPEEHPAAPLRDLPASLGERTAALAEPVVHVAEASASGLVLGRDSVLTVSLVRDAPPASEADSRTPLVHLTTLGPRDSVLPAAELGAVDSVAAGWVLLAARAPDGRPLSLAGLIGGVRTSDCGGLPVRELLFDAPVPETFVGGTMFDLDGRALAMALPCPDRVAIVPVLDLLALVERRRDPERIVWDRFGFRVAPMDSLILALLGADSGLVVTELLVGSLADAAGLRAGDIVTSDAALAELAASADGTRLRVRRRDGSVTLESRRGAQNEGELEIVRGPARQPPGLSIRHLPPDSRARRAGLQPDDRILQVGRDRSLTPAKVRRALADGAPVFLVYERAGHRRVLLLD